MRYLVARREDFRGKRVVIAGGGDSAVDWALSLKDIAAKVTVVHRRPKFRAAPETAAQLEAAAARGEVEMAIPYQLHGLKGDGATLTAVTLATLKGEETRHPRRPPAGLLRPVDGTRPDRGLGPRARPQPRRGAARDLRDQPRRRLRHRRHRDLSGQAEADPAGLQRGRDGRARHPPAGLPGEALHFEYSTTKGVPGAPDTPDFAAEKRRKIACRRGIVIGGPIGLHLPTGARFATWSIVPKAIDTASVASV